MLFSVDWLSLYCEIKVEHAFPKQSISQPLFNYHHELSSALQAVPALLTLFQFQSLSVDVLMQLLKRK